MVTTHKWTKGDHCRVDGMEGIACWFVEEDDEGWATVIMVGDDKHWSVEFERMHPLEEEGFCGNCGSTVCGWR